MSRGVVAAVTAFLVVFVVDALVRGVLVFPGVLICYFVFRYTWPLRGIAVSDQGVALMDRSFVHARPSRVITVLAPAELHISESKYRKRVAIGAEVVTLRGEDCRRWAQALAATDMVLGVSVSMTVGVSPDRDREHGGDSIRRLLEHWKCCAARLTGPAASARPSTSGQKP